MKRQCGKKIRVTFSDGTGIEESNACDTLALAIKKVGVKRVADLGIIGIGSQDILLLDKREAKDPGYRMSQKEVGEGYYLVTKTSTEKKVCDLCTIAQQLNIDMKVEIVAAKSKVQKNYIKTSCGDVALVKGEWMFQPTNEDENLRWIPFTDHWTYDTLALRHEGKYGIFTLPNMADYGNNGSLMWRALDKEPFPYDELIIKGMGACYYGMMAYRIGNKWGVSVFMYNPSQDCIEMERLVPCQFSSAEEAERHLSSWRNPFDENDEQPSEEARGIDVDITDNTRLEYLPRFDEFRRMNAGALNKYKKMTIKQFKAAYYRDNLKGRGNQFYDKILLYINSLHLK